MNTGTGQGAEITIKIKGVEVKARKHLHLNSLATGNGWIFIEVGKNIWQRVSWKGNLNYGLGRSREKTNNQVNYKEGLRRANEIRKLHATGKYSLDDLRARFEYKSTNSIRKILAGECYV